MHCLCSVYSVVHGGVCIYVWSVEIDTISISLLIVIVRLQCICQRPLKIVWSYELECGKAQLSILVTGNIFN